MVLTSGDFAGVNLLARLILVRRRKVFHSMKREFRFKVICTRGKSQNYSGYCDDPSFGNFQEHTGLPAQRKCFNGWAIPPEDTSIYLSILTA